MSTKDEVSDPYVRFYIQNGVEVATCLASDFRAAMNERDALRAENDQLRQTLRISRGVEVRVTQDRDDALHDAERLRAALEEIHARGYGALFADELERTGHRPWMHGTDGSSCWCHWAWPT